MSERITKRNEDEMINGIINSIGQQMIRGVKK